jgi:hypothetical protein
VGYEEALCAGGGGIRRPRRGSCGRFGGSDTNLNVTIQDAIIMSPVEVLVTGTSTCDEIVEAHASVNLDVFGNVIGPGGAGSAGAVGVQLGGKWSVTVPDEVPTAFFTPGQKAFVTATVTCAEGSPPENMAQDARTIVLNTN